MSIIPQNYDLEFKKYINNEISQLVNNMANNFLANLFSFSEEKYLKLVATLESDVKDLICKIIAKAITFFDDKFRDSKERKSMYHINIRYDDRCITTIWGDIHISRTYYETKDRKEHFYFIDELLGLEKYDRYDPIYKSMAIDLAIKTNQKVAGELVGKFTSTIEENLTNNLNNSVPRQTIHKWIKDWRVPMIDYPPIEIEGTTLYVMADEKFIHEQIKNSETKDDNTDEKKKKHNSIMSKCFVTFSGIEQKGKRRTLKDRMIFITGSDKPWDEFLDTVTKVYDFEKLENIVFLSDGGKWLAAGAGDLKMYPHNKIILCLCEYHARQYINRITTDEEIRKELNQYIDDNDKKAFKAKMAIIKEEKKDDEKKLKKLIQYEDYIVNNWKKIQNTFDCEYGSSMESHISHYVASYFGSRPKAFSRNNIQSLLKLVEAKMNGVDIQKLYLKSYKNTETVTLEKEELNFSLFETSSSSNVPVIEYGNNSSLFSALIGLSHGY